MTADHYRAGQWQGCSAYYTPGRAADMPNKTWHQKMRDLLTVVGLYVVAMVLMILAVVL